MSWWHSLPDWAKPVVLNSVLTVALGALTWLASKGIKQLTMDIHEYVLNRMEDTAKRKLHPRMKYKQIPYGLAQLMVDNTTLIAESNLVVEAGPEWVPRGVWLSAVKRAKKWEEKQKRRSERISGAPFPPTWTQWPP